MISSLTPSEKNCISVSLDRLSKASTASSGSAAGAGGDEAGRGLGHAPCLLRTRRRRERIGARGRHLADLDRLVDTGHVVEPMHGPAQRDLRRGAHRSRGARSRRPCASSGCALGRRATSRAPRWPWPGPRPPAVWRRAQRRRPCSRAAPPRRGGCPRARQGRRSTRHRVHLSATGRRVRSAPPRSGARTATESRRSCRSRGR